MTTFKVLDAFSCTGGAGEGYAQAGADVTAVDQEAKALSENRSPHKVTGDAIAYVYEHGHEYDLIHGSPPCQRFTRGNVSTDRAEKWPDLIGPFRKACQAVGVPYVIENVEGAARAGLLIDPVILCGSMFGLGAIDDDGTRLHLQRHRAFEVHGFDLPLLPPHQHPRGVQWAGVYGGARRDKWEAKHVRKGGYVPPNLDVLRALLGTPWIKTERYLFEAIPPVYTAWLADAFLSQMAVAA